MKIFFRFAAICAIPFVPVLGLGLYNWYTAFGMEQSLAATLATVICAFSWIALAFFLGGAFERKP